MEKGKRRVITETETGKVFEIEVESLSSLEGNLPGKCSSCHKDIDELPFLWVILYAGFSPSSELFFHMRCREEHARQKDSLYFNFN